MYLINYANKALVICFRLAWDLQTNIALKSDMNLYISIVTLVDNVKIMNIMTEINVLFSKKITNKYNLEV